MLFIEYDVDPDGMIELVALIDATEENGEDPDGEVWHSWRRTHEDNGHGCVRVARDDREALEAITDAEEARTYVERLILEHRQNVVEVEA